MSRAVRSQSASMKSDNTGQMNTEWVASDHQKEKKKEENIEEVKQDNSAVKETVISVSYLLYQGRADKNKNIKKLTSAIWESSSKLAQSGKFQLKALITAELMSLLLAALSALSCEIYLKITKNYNNFFC